MPWTTASLGHRDNDGHHPSPMGPAPALLRSTHYPPSGVSGTPGAVEVDEGSSGLRQRCGRPFEGECKRCCCGGSSREWLRAIVACPGVRSVPARWGGGGGTRPVAVPIGLSPLLILTLCGSEHVLVVSTEPPDDLSCLTTPGVGRPGDGLLPVPLTRCIQMRTPRRGGGGGGGLVQSGSGEHFGGSTSTQHVSGLEVIDQFALGVVRCHRHHRAAERPHDHMRTPTQARPSNSKTISFSQKQHAPPPPPGATPNLVCSPTCLHLKRRADMQRVHGPALAPPTPQLPPGGS